jgi:hypothetical protein
MKNKVKNADLTIAEKLELFNVEELEQRLEMSKWIDTFNGICPEAPSTPTK